MSILIMPAIFMAPPPKLSLRPSGCVIIDLFIDDGILARVFHSTEKIQLMQEEKEGVLGRSIESGKWMMAGALFQRLLGIVSLVVLARMLSPRDFGIMAIVLLVPRLLQSVSETGFGAAAIQREGAIEPYLNPLWTIAIVKSCAIALLVWVAGPWIVQFFHVPEAMWAVRLGGLAIVVQNLANVGELFFFKNLNFRKVVIRDTIRESAYVVAAIAAAFFLRSHWALFLGTLAGFFAQTLSTYFLNPYRPRLSWQWGALRDLVAESKWFVFQGWLSLVVPFLEQTVIGRLLNAAQVGLYAKAKSIASLPPGFLNSVIATVSFPAYARIKDDRGKIREGLMRSADLLFFVLIPVTVLVAAGGGKLILIFLGPQWLPMIGALRVLLVMYLMVAVVDLAYALLNGIGHPDKKAKFEALRVGVTLPLIVLLTARAGILGTALALVCGIIPTFGLSVRALARLTGLPWRSMLKAALVPAAAAGITLIPALVWKENLLALSIPALLGAIAGMGILYLAGIAAAGTKGYGPYATLTLVARVLRRRRSL